MRIDFKHSVDYPSVRVIVNNVRAAATGWYYILDEDGREVKRKYFVKCERNDYVTKCVEQ